MGGYRLIETTELTNGRHLFFATNGTQIFEADLFAGTRKANFISALFGSLPFNITLALEV